MCQQEPPPPQHTAPLQSPCQHWKLRMFSPQLNLRLWHHWNITMFSILPAPPQAGEVLIEESWSRAGIGMRGCRKKAELDNIGSISLHGEFSHPYRSPTSPPRGGEEPNLLFLHTIRSISTWHTGLSQHWDGEGESFLPAKGCGTGVKLQVKMALDVLALEQCSPFTSSSQPLALVIPSN